jgi:hypothetical protein
VSSQKVADADEGRQRSGREVFSVSCLRERLSPIRATSMVISRTRRGSSESECLGHPNASSQRCDRCEFLLNKNHLPVYL